MLACLTLLFATSAHASGVVERTLPRSVPLLRIDNPTGSVTVYHDPLASESRIAVVPKTSSAKCRVAFGGDAAAAEMRIEREDGRSGLLCPTDVDVWLAGATRLDVGVGLGRVELSGLVAPAQVHVGRGRILLDDIATPVALDVSSGRIRGNALDQVNASVRQGGVRLEGLQAPVTAEVGFGSVQLAYDEQIFGTVEATARVGRVRTLFPYGTWLDRDADTTVGLVRTRIPARSSAQTHLVASSGLGTVNIDTIVVDEAPTVASAE